MRNSNGVLHLGSIVFFPYHLDAVVLHRGVVLALLSRIGRRAPVSLVSSISIGCCSLACLLCGGLAFVPWPAQRLDPSPASRI